MKDMTDPSWILIKYECFWTESSEWNSREGSLSLSGFPSCAWVESKDGWEIVLFFKEHSSESLQLDSPRHLTRFHVVNSHISLVDTLQYPIFAANFPVPLRSLSRLLATSISSPAPLRRTSKANTIECRTFARAIQQKTKPTNGWKEERLRVRETRFGCVVKLCKKLSFLKYSRPFSLVRWGGRARRARRDDSIEEKSASSEVRSRKSANPHTMIDDWSGFSLSLTLGSAHRADTTWKSCVRARWPPK